MKIRNGFVSNSSSSSFTVSNVRMGYDMIQPTRNDIYIIGNEGETEFGWGEYAIRDVHSRINWAFIQAAYLIKQDKKPEDIFCIRTMPLKYNKSCREMNMLLDLIKENSKIKEVSSNITQKWESKNKKYGYIDHQSASYEGVNLEIFKSKESLRDFIFGRDSIIFLDNDNH